MGKYHLENSVTLSRSAAWLLALVLATTSTLRAQVITREQTRSDFQELERLKSQSSPPISALNVLGLRFVAARDFHLAMQAWQLASREAQRQADTANARDYSSRALAAAEEVGSDAVLDVVLERQDWHTADLTGQDQAAELERLWDLVRASKSAAIAVDLGEIIFAKLSQLARTGAQIPTLDERRRLLSRDSVKARGAAPTEFITSWGPCFQSETFRSQRDLIADCWRVVDSVAREAPPQIVIPRRVALAILLARAGDSRGARAQIYSAKQLAGTDPDWTRSIARGLGLVLAEEGDRSGAAQAFAEALRVDIGYTSPDERARLLSEAAEALAIDGRTAAATDAWRRLLRIETNRILTPFSYSSARRMYDAYVALNDSGLANRMLQRLADSATALDDVPVIMAIANRARARGDYHTELAYLDSAAAVIAAMATKGISDRVRRKRVDQLADIMARSIDTWLRRAPEIGVASAEDSARIVSCRFQSALFSDPNAFLGACENESWWGFPAGVVLQFAATPTEIVLWATRLRSPADSHIIVADRTQMFRMGVSADSLSRLVDATRAAIGVEGATRTIREQAARTRSSMRALRPLPGTPDSVLSALAHVLIPPALHSLLPDSGHLVIVPFGAVSFVPWAALPLPRIGGMLGDRFSVSQLSGTRTGPPLAQRALRADSADRPLPLTAECHMTIGKKSAARESNCVDRQRAIRRQVLGTDAIIMGNPVMPNPPGTDRPLTPLPSAGREASRIAALLGTTAFTGSKATEALARARFPKARIVHIASHGASFSEAEDPERSFVALAPGDGHDGILTAGELLGDSRLELSATLIVLSACQTGLGGVSAIEGVLGLARAFIARGAASVLVSLWSVSDFATANLMERFYRHWLFDRDRPSKAAALRRAQSAMRTDPRFFDPVYWAGFQLVGAER